MIYFSSKIGTSLSGPEISYWGADICITHYLPQGGYVLVDGTEGGESEIGPVYENGVFSCKEALTFTPIAEHWLDRSWATTLQGDDGEIINSGEFLRYYRHLLKGEVSPQTGEALNWGLYQVAFYNNRVELRFCDNGKAGGYETVCLPWPRSLDTGICRGESDLLLSVPVQRQQFGYLWLKKISAQIEVIYHSSLESCPGLKAGTDALEIRAVQKYATGSHCCFSVFIINDPEHDGLIVKRYYPKAGFSADDLMELIQVKEGYMYC